jgi:hypothetical protein
VREYLIALRRTPPSFSPSEWSLVKCLEVFLQEIEALKLAERHPLMVMPLSACDEGPSPVERELWEALDRLIAECHRQAAPPSLPLTVAKYVRDRLRALMSEGTGA